MVIVTVHMGCVIDIYECMGDGEGEWLLRFFMDIYIYRGVKIA